MVIVLDNSAKLLKRLLERFVDEVERGTHPLEAGWIKSERPEGDELIELELVERGDRGIRLQLHKNLELVNTQDRDLEELINICSDLARAVEVEKVILRVADEFPKSSYLQAGIVALGWWRMLETSEFPVVVDEVLREGFTPDGWYIEVPKAAMELALTLANKWWEVDMKKSFEILEKYSFPIPKTHKTEVFEKVKKVLRWEEVRKMLPEHESKTLAFLWCLDYLCISSGLCYPQSYDFVQASASKIVSKLMMKDISDITEHVGELVGKLPFQSFISWAEIIRFPW